ncbi:TPA: hypothetical protein N0F65_000172, partial [Lagenidium giganteum]
KRLTKKPYSHEQYIRTRESRLAAQKRYYQKNREKRLAQQKEYDDAHRDEISTRHKENKYTSRKTKKEVECAAE